MPTLAVYELIPENQIPPGIGNKIRLSFSSWNNTIPTDIIYFFTRVCQRRQSWETLFAYACARSCQVRDFCYLQIEYTRTVVKSDITWGDCRICIGVHHQQRSLSQSGTPKGQVQYILDKRNNPLDNHGLVSYNHNQLDDGASQQPSSLPSATPFFCLDPEDLPPLFALHPVRPFLMFL